MTRAFLSVPAALLSLSMPVAASAGSLPPLTVTAPAPQAGTVPQEDAAAASTTITAETIDRQQMQRLEDALRQVPGVVLGPQRGLGLERSVSLRGLGARNVRVFVDGVEMSDTSQAQSQYKITDLNMRDIDRIDVLRGPQTGRFGADSAGGVINIVTRRPTAPVSGQAGFEAGSYGTLRGYGNAAGVSGPVDWRLSASGAEIAGYSDFRGGEREDPFRQWGVNGALGVQVNDAFRLEALARYQRRDVFYDASYGDVNWNRDETERVLRLGGSLSSLSGRLHSRFGVADTLTTRQYWGQGTKGDTYDGGKTRLDYAGTYTVSEQVSLGFGVDATRERIAQRTPGFAPTAGPLDQHFWKTGAYTTLGVTPLAGWDVSATLRGDSHEEFDSRATWRLGSAYAIAATGTTLRGGYGTSWQTPSLYERFDPCYGSATLRPEAAKGWDVGVDQAFWGQRAKAGITYFRTSTEDEIAWMASAPQRTGCNGGQYVNFNRTRSQGVEMETSLRLTETLSATASYGWMQADNDLTGQRLRDRPLHQASGGLDWQARPDLLLGASVRYRDNTTNPYSGRSDEFWTADLRVGWQVGDGVTVQGRLENLFDAEYEEDPGYGTPGRSGYVGAAVAF